MKTQITKIIETETGHRLCNYEGKCAHIHGHRYRWEVTVTAHKLDDIGFVIDYGNLKRILKDVIEPLDHAFVISNEDPLIQAAETLGIRVATLLEATNGDEPRLFVNNFNPTTENLIDWVAPDIIADLPEGLFLHKIRVWETSTSFAEREFVTCA